VVVVLGVKIRFVVVCHTFCIVLKLYTSMCIIYLENGFLEGGATEDIPTYEGSGGLSERCLCYRMIYH